MTYDVTESQRAVLNRLPDTRRSIADDLGTTIRAVRYRMDAMEDEGFKFRMDSDGIWNVTEEPSDHESREPEEPKRVDSYSKAQATKDVHNELTKMEKEIKEIKNRQPPVTHDYDYSTGKATLVIPLSDLHFGAVVEERQGEDGFKSVIAEERVNQVVNKAIARARKRGDVEDVELGLFGDMVDGENIYPGHKAHLEKFLRGQIKHASSVLYDQVKKLSDEFEHVEISMCPGNHGSIAKDAISNADDIVYDQLETAIAMTDLDNVNINHSPNGSFVEFDIRGWQGYARHGQDALSHASTSSGQARWLTWKESCDFDIAYHGHHHSFRMEPVGRGAYLFQCGTPVPPSLYADSVGATGVPESFFHFTTAVNPVENIVPVRF